ncbi:unnamed protein product [Acanthoscelides obtectus]|nr:unnamed protein product [Acanthoscelides obtectus]CAK1666417.1 hypothetical protein AOBTE_LOCUS25316 [Acanthoscelides obtectus]
MAIVTGGVSMAFGGSNEPCAYASLMSIGALGVSENKKHSKAIAECMASIGVPADRMYIHFVDSPSSVVGYNGSTFHDILG